MLIIFEGGQAGHAWGIKPEWPGNLSFVFPGNLNTIYGCRLVARRAAGGRSEFKSQGYFDRRPGAAGRSASGHLRCYYGGFARGMQPESSDPRLWKLGSSTSGNQLATWVLTWTVTHSGSTIFGEARVPGPSLSSAGSKPVRWLQANVTGASNIESVLELNADISLLTEVRCSGKALGKEC